MTLLAGYFAVASRVVAECRFLYVINQQWRLGGATAHLTWPPPRPPSLLVRANARPAGHGGSITRQIWNPGGGGAHVLTVIRARDFL